MSDDMHAPDSLDENISISATLHVKQDNDKMMIVIESVDDPHGFVAEILGSSAADMHNMQISHFLPDDIMETIDEYVDYSPDGHADFDTVIRRMPHFALLPNQGRRVFLEQRIERSVSEDTNPRFMLKLSPPSNPFADEYAQLQALKLQESELAHIPVPDRAVFENALEIAYDMLHKDSTVPCCVGMLAINRFETLPIDATKTVMHAVLSSIKSNLRDTDLVAYLGAGKVAILMPETGYDTADIPLKRMRIDLRVLPDVRQHGLDFVGVYAELPGDADIEEFIEQCEICLKDPGRFPHVSSLSSGLT